FLCSPCYGCLRVCPSFPTRRSSDLAVRPLSPFRAVFAYRDTGTIISDRRRFGKWERAETQGPLFRQDPAKRQGRPHACPAVLLSDRKSTRLNSSHVSISYAVFCLKK